MRRLLLAGLTFACMLAAQPKAATSSIEGHVFNSLTSEPLRKATVTLTGPQMQLTDETDASGKFQFTGLPPGTYRLSASRAGFLDHAARRPVSLGSNKDVPDSEIRLPPQGAIAGRVVDEDNEPSPGVQVFIFKQVYRDGRKQWQQLNTDISNDAGEYRLSKLAPGRYILRARLMRPQPNNRFGDRPKMVYGPAWYPNASTQEEALPVEVGVGAEVRDVDIHLSKRVAPPVFHVSGKVVGAPADSPNILVSALGGSELECSGGGSAIARPPDYAFDLAARPGQCNISASLQPDSVEAHAVYGSASLTVSGDVTGVVVAMTPPAVVTGKVSVAESSSQVKLQGMNLVLYEIPSRASEVARSDATGKFSFARPMRAGHYSLSIESALPDGCFLRDVKLGGQETSPDDIELQGAAQLELVLSKTAGKIKGSVSDADGNPFPIASVTLIPADGKSRPVKQSLDDKGNFQFAGLRPGKYTLFAWEEVDDGQWQDPDFRKKYEDRSSEVTVGASETQNAQLRVIPVEEIK